MSRKGKQARNKLKQELLRKQHERKHRGVAPVKLSRKQTERLMEAYELIHRGEYEYAEQLLKKLDIQSGGNSAEIVEALVFLDQTRGNHESCCEAAERLMKLRPADAEAHIMYAQESMYCGRATIALIQYQEFIERWPDHALVSNAKQALQILVPETERRIKMAAFPAESALQACLLHEEALALLQRGNFVACAEKCQKLLAIAPNFTSARNNLAVAYFQSGRANEAVAILETTRQISPDNRFAEATLAKMYFLTGRAEQAQPLADNIVANPPAERDALVTALEMLAFLGRDEDVVRLAETVSDRQLADQQSQAMRLHFLAYAKCRLGDTKAAKGLWLECVERFKPFSEAGENLNDMRSGHGHAPWGASFGKWIPRDVIEVLNDNSRCRNHTDLTQYPAIAALIPALLDRGDPLGREVAMRLAMADRSPPMLSALQDFAFGSRGPDAMRFEVLAFLRKQKVLGAGPHRVCSRGKWTEILLAAEITHEPRPSGSSERVLDLLEEGYEALRTNDFERAEALFSDALQEEPDNCSANYNLCAVWIHRDGEPGERRALPRLEQLHREHPGYMFAAIALAQLAADKGDFQRARDLLSPCYQADQWHVTEASALLAVQAAIAAKQGDIEAAERTLDMLRDITDKDDPNVMAVRCRIDAAAPPRGLRRLFPWI
jgi:Flp pilus assembly protein TadD